jgi:hypothetical protein
VDHEPHPVVRQPAVRPREFRFAGGAAAERDALREEFRPGGTVDHAVHAATPEEAAVRGVDDGVDALRGDVSQDRFDRGPRQ